MDLEKAFGKNFSFTSNVPPLLQPERLGMEIVSTAVEQSSNVQQVTPPEITNVQNVQNVQPVHIHPQPDVYLIQIQIGRDDCHLLCTFLLVFIVSFLLSSRNKS